MKILCVYCNKIWDAEMQETLAVAEGSYTPDCVGSKIYGSVDIYCTNCKKLVYKKEISQGCKILDWEKE
jgi:hypothetical protein